VDRYLRWSTVLLLIIAGLASCAGKPEVGIEKEVVYERPMPQLETEYTLGPGDVVEIIYHFTPRPDTKDYIISVSDVVKVEFAYHPDMDRELTVAPDGNITMPRKGPVLALGRTTVQLQEKIAQIYSKEFIDPVVTVTMVQYNRTIDRLKNAIRTAARGESKISPVRPDGYLSLPVIQDVLAGGRTIPEIRQIIQAEYQKQVDNMTVSVLLQQMTANLSYIFGQIRYPNTYLMQHNLTVSQLISRAGGLTESAEPRTVLVISRDKQRRPWGRLIDIEKVIRDGDLSQDVVLNQYDIVFVPKSKIARRNLWVKQYIDGMIPNSLIGAYSLGGQAFGGTLIDTGGPLIDTD
jgi:protein involved in polysaccharide export with SLBB domain